MQYVTALALVLKFLNLRIDQDEMVNSYFPSTDISYTFPYIGSQIAAHNTISFQFLYIDKCKFIIFFAISRNVGNNNCVFIKADIINASI